MEDLLVVARQQELGEVIHLYRAMGGGWSVAKSVEKSVPENVGSAGDVENNGDTDVTADKEQIYE